MLLPLRMTSWLGRFTISWALIICFFVLVLEDIAVQTGDRFSMDNIDIHVNEMCEKAPNSLIEAAWEVD